jgi:LmbE family N-acetylglucosaminyl deacetylase
MFDNAFKVSKLYHMEINSLITQPTIMMDVSKYYESAIEALQCHKSQIEKADGYYLKLYDARTRLRGVQAACSRAEAFTLIPTKHVGPFYPENNVKSLV